MLRFLNIWKHVMLVSLWYTNDTGYTYYTSVYALPVLNTFKILAAALTPIN